MQRFPFYIFFVGSFLLGCGDHKEATKDGFSYEIIKSATNNSSVEKKVSASQKTDLSTKGIGPVSSLELPANIDNALAEKGKTIFTKMCTACHRPNKKFIGPAAKGVITRRTPEWIMNMILNPDEMIRKEPLAKELLAEFEYAPMIKQNMTFEETRAILEYYRTLK